MRVGEPGWRLGHTQLSVFVGGKLVWDQIIVTSLTSPLLWFLILHCFNILHKKICIHTEENINVKNFSF